MAASNIGKKASEAYSAAAALANPFTRRIAEAINSSSGSSNNGGTNNNNSNNKNSGGRKSSRNNNLDEETDPVAGSGSSTPFNFIDNMCGPMLRNFNNGDNGNGGSNTFDDDDDIIDDGGRGRRGGRDRDNRGGTRGRLRRPQSSYDYDDETFATDATGSYDNDDDDDNNTYDDHDDSRERRNSNKSSSSSRNKHGGRGRDRKPRSPTTGDDASASAYSDFDATTEGGDTATDVSSAHYDNKKLSSSSTSKSNKKGGAVETTDVVINESAAVTISTNKESEKLITQPLASGFAKRCYFTKAGIGRSTQHYEGLTLTGNTVLMLAAAMKLKGCPTICDEDLRRVEQTYPNQFSRLPDELLLSSGWRRISKYCHFSHKALPDGVPFFHSRKRCHPTGGFYFLLCSAVGMNRLMDVEPLNRDALAVMQTDFPLTCEKAPECLMEDPAEWTLVNKFCFFSGGPINVDEDVYYRAELGGTAIYMLAFLSPSLSPEELYRLKQPNSAAGENGAAPQGQHDNTGPLKSVAAVEEVESVYDLTERDFDDLKLYHLGPCRAVPPYLLHPDAWIKVLPPHFQAARDEALRIAREFEGPMAASQDQDGRGDDMMRIGETPSSDYVELQAGGHPSSRGGNMPPPHVGPGGFPPSQYHHMQQDPNAPPQYQQQDPNAPYQQDPNAPYYPPPQPGPGGVDQAGFPIQHPQQYGGDMNYYYGGIPPQGAPHPHQLQQPSPGMMHMSNNPYGNPNMGQGHPSPDRMNAMAGGGPPPQFHHSGPSQEPYGNAPPMNPQHWRDVQEEGAFGRLGGGGDVP